jgi:hypothetical protein
MVDGVKTFISFFQKLDPNANLIIKELGVGDKHLPAIKSVSDPHFPKEYITPTAGLLALNPLHAKVTAAFSYLSHDMTM